VNVFIQEAENPNPPGKMCKYMIPLHTAASIFTTKRPRPARMKSLFQSVRRYPAAGLTAGLALLLLIAGCSATKTTDSIESTVKVGKADELATQALQQYFTTKNVPAALKLLQQAVKSAPQRIDMQWLYFELCAQVLDCSTEPTEARLLKLDPENGAVQLGVLARAQREQDVAAETEALEAISRSPVFKIYWNSLISKMARVAARDVKRPQPITRSLNEITDWYSNLAGATFGPILVACRSTSAVADPATNARCMRIAGLLLRSDTYIGETVGFSLAEQLLGKEQAQKILERRAASQYQRDAASEVINAQMDREKLSSLLLNLMDQLPREQDVFLALLQWRDQPTTPGGR
jgi:hypothetical protein